MSVEGTKNIVNIPKITIEKSPIVDKSNIVTPTEIVTKPKIATKPKIVDKPKMAIEKNINYNKYKGLIDKINNKIRWTKTLEKFKEKVKNKINLINKLIFSKLETKIYADDYWSELDELNKIDDKTDATADKAINLICNMMGKKNRKRLKKINIDKKEELLDRVYDLLDHIIREMIKETDEIYMKMCDVNMLDKDELYLINDKLNEIKAQSRKNLIKIEDILCQ